MSDHELEQVNGTVETVIFQSQDTGFTVLELNTGDELLSVVGELGGVSEGEELILTGTYTNHPTYGEQFKTEVYERSFPSTANAIRKYLASGVVKGIGPAIARRIVEAFGDETLEVIQNTPEKLGDITGISKRKAKQIAEDFKEIFGIRTVMLYLNQYGISSSTAVCAWKEWGSSSVEIIKANPYVLCSAELQVSFGVADEIATENDFSVDDFKRILAGLQYILRINVNNGYDTLPRDQLVGLGKKLLKVSEDSIEITIDQAIENKELYVEKLSKDYIFLPAYYLAEHYIAKTLKILSDHQPHAYDNMDILIQLVQEEKNIVYESLQKEAIKKALENSVFILTGGPGTGKTTTLNGIIALLEQQGLHVSIAAPTGRAAKRIAEVTGRDATTIHRLLEVDRMIGFRQQFKRNEQNLLKADAIIIDEVSMVDTLLFQSLLRALKPDARLILVGDANQLPSVSAGNVLHDLIDSKCIPTVELQEIFRQAAKSLIVKNAHKIVHGEMPDLDRRDNDFFFISRTNTEDVSSLVVDLCVNRLPKSYGFSPLDDIQVLSPSRKGPLGILELNRQLQMLINPPSDDKKECTFGAALFREGDKIMQTRNNYDITWTKNEVKGEGIFNGDIGIIRYIDRAGGVIAIDFDQRIAYYTMDMLKEIELAYAVTVHKSQGNEFNAIVLPLFSGYDQLYFRNLLYTAVTRAKKILVIVGSKERIAFMVRNNRKMLRYTCQKHLIRQYFDKTE